MEYFLTTDFWLFLTGVIPLISSPLSLWGQLSKSYKMKKMDQVSWLMLALFLITSSSCLIHVFILKAWWMCAKDLAAFSCAVALFTMKLLYDVLRKRK